MEYDIIDTIKSALTTALPNFYIGYYPSDYQYIFNSMPALLIKLGDNSISAEGHHKYIVVANTQFILYSMDSIDDVLDDEQKILDTIIETLHSISTDCIRNIMDTTIQAGDINDYVSPSQTGYNANIIVRKLTTTYQFVKII